MRRVYMAKVAECLRLDAVRVTAVSRSMASSRLSSKKALAKFAPLSSLTPRRLIRIEPASPA